MSIDAARVLEAPAVKTSGEWSSREVILYHLGLGAGADPVDPKELEYVLEDRLKVLPTFGVLSASAGAGPVFTTPGLEFDQALMLHGEQSVEIHTPLPPDAKVTHSARMAEIWDKGNAALGVIEVSTTTLDGVALSTSRFGMFFRGAGGFGGEPGPQVTQATPARECDDVITVPTLPQQALIYRLSGDTNPLHSDPKFASRAGFERPILHGQCWYGMACKAVIDRYLDGDVSAVKSWSARFAGTIYPGETLALSCWRDGDRTVVTGVVPERNATVLSHGILEQIN